MSLFPAYSVGGESSSQEIKDGNSWLDNASFITSVKDIKPRSSSISSDDSENLEPEAKLCKVASDESIDNGISRTKKTKKKKKKMSKKRRHSKKVEVNLSSQLQASNGDDIFALETLPNQLYLKMTEIDKKNRPRYQCPCKFMKGVFPVKFSNKKRKNVRYFSNKFINSGQDDEATGQELSHSVEELNKAVHQDPSVIDNWLKLVSFQDDYFKFQPIRFKSPAELDRAAKLQKLTILERAMSANAGNEILLRTWLELALDYCTFDEVKSKLTSLSQEQDSMILFLGNIMMTQQSMTRCTSPAVLNSYKQSMQRLQRSKCFSSTLQDNYTLELFCYACIFLEQCGLWEMAWMAVKLLLSLNLSINLPSVEESDDVILEEENRILGSRSDIPLWNLWPALETIRQGCHFLPVSTSDNFPQRVVASDDVAELVYHVRKDSTFRLLVLLPILSRVPMLPRYHSFLSSVFSQLPSWAFDNVEHHLAACFMQSPLMKITTEFIARHLPQDYSPQFLRRLPGQWLFLNFTTNVFDLVLGATSGRERVFFGVWYLRFLRWLDSLARVRRFDCPANQKKTRTLIKEFLKKEANRDVLLFYVEFALWEYENGDVDAAVKILDTLAKLRSPVLEQANEECKSYLCSLYRTLCEVQIAAGQLEGAINTLKQLVRSSSRVSAGLKLKHVALEAVRGEQSCDLDLMLPSFTVDWIACYVWFLALDGMKDDAVDFVKEALRDATGGIREKLYEILVLLEKNFPQEVEKINLSFVYEAVKEFPLNSMFSTYIAASLVEKNGFWWKDSYHLLHEPSSMGSVLLICAALERNRLRGHLHERLRSLFSRLTNKVGRSSAVLHRMFMKYLFDTGHVTAVEEARVLALEACPWNKSLYMDAIAVNPKELISITDIMVEKDLRLHIAPDEIDAMRD